MSKPEAFSIPNNTNMTHNTSYHPLPVSCIKQDENMQAVDRSEKVFALPCGISYSVLLAVVVTVCVRGFKTAMFSHYSQGNSSLLLCILTVCNTDKTQINSCLYRYLLPSKNISDFKCGGFLPKEYTDLSICCNKFQR